MSEKVEIERFSSKIRKATNPTSNLPFYFLTCIFFTSLTYISLLMCNRCLIHIYVHTQTLLFYYYLGYVFFRVILSYDLINHVIYVIQESSFEISLDI